eukprot:TRINITY_DN17013_c0_g2_i1.p1 TRINITY_DN17013_c0_g2~~TRINITY_DN17013_c0_g2_i1.p1  ORF type:complete len:468 (-),score=76.56 TRINITY_DN17013_c0_g2_i1:77-1480(-)
MDNLTLTLYVNGEKIDLSSGVTYTGLPNECAVAASLWETGDSVQIVRYQVIKGTVQDIGIGWDPQANKNEQLVYSKKNQMATIQRGSATIRTPFLKTGRHIFHVKIMKMGHVGVGVVGNGTKNFDEGSVQMIGSDLVSWATWDTLSAYHAGFDLAPQNTLRLIQGDIVKIDLDLCSRQLTFYINNEKIELVSSGVTFTGLPEECALAASLTCNGDCVQILNYEELPTEMPEPIGIAWETNLNPHHLTYTARNEVVTSKTSEGVVSTRTKFLTTGHHILTIKILKSGRVGVGVISKEKNLSVGQFLGDDNCAWFTWDNLSAFHGGVDASSSFGFRLRQGSLVVLDLDLDRRRLNFVIDGNPVRLDGGVTFARISAPCAFAASLCGVTDCVQIVGYQLLNATVVRTTKELSRPRSHQGGTIHETDHDEITTEYFSDGTVKKTVVLVTTITRPSYRVVKGPPVVTTTTEI